MFMETMMHCTLTIQLFTDNYINNKILREQVPLYINNTIVQSTSYYCTFIINYSGPTESFYIYNRIIR